MGRFIASEVVDGNRSFCGDDAPYIFWGTTGSFFSWISELCSGMSGGFFSELFCLALPGDDGGVTVVLRRGLPAADGSAVTPRPGDPRGSQSHVCSVCCLVLCFYVQAGVFLGPLAYRGGDSLRPGRIMRACASLPPAGVLRPACVLQRMTDCVGPRMVELLSAARCVVASCDFRDAW